MNMPEAMANAPETQDGQTKNTVCPLDCADTCSLSVTVKNDRVEAVRGGNRNPFTRSKLCAKVVNSFPSQVHGDLRITTPLLREKTLSGSSFRPINWDEALDLIHERFSAVIDRWGSEAVAPLYYGGPMGLLAGGSMDKRFFHRLGASSVDASTLCAGTSSAAWDTVFGDAGGIDFDELAHSRLIIVWGNNVTTCNLHLTKVIREAKKAGAVVVVIDPKKIRIAKDADLHIPLLPGSDVALAYAVANLLAEADAIDGNFVAANTLGSDAFLEEARSYTVERAAKLCGVDGETIRSFATLLMENSPAAMSIGVGPERNRNGSAGIRAAFSLMALSGNIGPLGAGVCDTSRYFPVNRDALARPDLQGKSVRTLNVMDIPRYVLEPGDETPLRALLIYNHNPVAVHPEQARMREALLSDDVFVVGSDVSMTDSMRCADLVLPAPSHFEYGDIYKAYGHRYLQRSRPVISPQGDAISNMELFRRLAERFGFTDPCFKDSDEDLAQQALDGSSATLVKDALYEAVDMEDHAEPGMLRGGAFTTPSGRIELYSQAMEDHCGQGLPQFLPLGGAERFQLVTPASEQRVNSTFGGIASQQRDLVCEINPIDAADLGIGDGQSVVLRNEAGAVQLPAKVSDDIREGTVYVPKGAWLSGSENAMTCNALIPGDREVAIGGACYYDCTVDISPAI
ncbi:MAG: molybdopterin-dependent oxidoreductase [Pseudomonadota bacterium]